MKEEIWTGLEVLSKVGLGVLYATVGILSTAIVGWAAYTKWGNLPLAILMGGVGFFLGILIVHIFVWPIQRLIKSLDQPHSQSGLWQWLQGQQAKYDPMGDYRKYLERFYKTDKIEGFHENSTALDITDLYIDLELIHSNTASDSSLRSQSASSSSKPRIIWDFLQLNTLEEQPSLVILGSPGSGKSTLLKFVLLTLLNAKRKRERKIQKDWFPILLTLRQQRESIIQNENITLAELLENQVKLNRPLPSGWFSAQLMKRHSLILLDGLDEIADEGQRKQVVNWIERQIVATGKHRFVITSRPRGYQDNPFKQVSVDQVAIQDLTHPQQKELILNWFNQLEQRRDPDYPERAQMQSREKSDKTWHLIQTDPVRRQMAHNPLLLRLMVAIYDANGFIPNNRLELYREISTVLLGKRAQGKDINLPIGTDTNRMILQKLAWGMLQEEGNQSERGEVSDKVAQALVKDELQAIAPNLSAESFLEGVVLHTGMLVKPDDETYAFAHLTFMEYLAALELKENHPFETIMPHLDTPNWFEVLRFYGMMGATSQLIEVCMTEPVREQPLILALDLQEAGGRIESKTRTKLEAWLERAIDDAHGESVYVLCNAYWKRREHQLLRLGDARWLDTKPLTNLEMASFYRQHPTLPYHWDATTHLYRSGKGNDSFKGMRETEMEAWLERLNQHQALASDGEGRWRYRLPSLTELGGKDGIYRLEDGSLNYRESGESRLDLGHISWGVSSDPDLAHAYTLAHDHAIALDRAINHYSDLDRLLNLDHALDLCLDLDHTLNLALGLDSDLRRILARARAFELTLDLYHTLDLARNFAPDSYNLSGIDNDLRSIAEILIGRITILHTLQSQVEWLPNWLPHRFQRLSTSIRERVNAINWADTEIQSSIQKSTRRLEWRCQHDLLRQDQLLEVVYRGLTMRWWINQTPQVNPQEQQAVIKMLDELTTRALIGIAHHYGWVEPFGEIYLVRERVD